MIRYLSNRRNVFYSVLSKLILFITGYRNSNFLNPATEPLRSSGLASSKSKTHVLLLMMISMLGSLLFTNSTNAQSSYTCPTGVTIQTICPAVPPNFCTSVFPVPVPVGCVPTPTNGMTLGTTGSALGILKYVYSTVDPVGVTTNKPIWFDLPASGSTNAYDISTAFGAGWPSAPANKIWFAFINTSNCISVSYVEAGLINPPSGPGTMTSTISGTNTETRCITNGTPISSTFNLTGVNNLLTIPPDYVNTLYRFNVTYNNAFTNGTFNTTGTTAAVLSGTSVNGITFTRSSITAGTLSVTGIDKDWTVCANGSVTITIEANNCGSTWTPFQTVTINLVPNITNGGSLSAGGTTQVCTSPGTSATFTYLPPSCAQGYITGTTNLQLQVSIDGAAYINVGGSTTNPATINSTANAYVMASAACGTKTYQFRVVASNPNSCGSQNSSATATITSYPTLALPGSISITNNASTTASASCSGGNITVTAPYICGALATPTTTYSVSATVLAGGAAISAGTLPTIGQMSAVFTNASGGNFTLNPTNNGSTCVVGQVRYDFTLSNPICGAQTYSTTVNVLPSISSAGTLSYSLSSVCAGSNITGINFTAPVCGTSGTVAGVTTYTLQVSSNNGSTWSNVAAATTNPASLPTTYTTPSTCAFSNYRFQVLVQNPTTHPSATGGTCNSAVTPLVGNVPVYPSVTAASLSSLSNTVLCSGSSANVTTDLSSAPCWYSAGITNFTIGVSSSSGVATTGLPGTVTNTSGNFSVNPTIAAVPSAIAGTVTYTITAQNGTCASAVVGTVTICVYPTPVVGGTITGPVVNVCSGNNFNLTVNNVDRTTNNVVNTNGTCGGTTYSWSTPALPSGVTSGINTQFSAITGAITSATNASFTPTNNTCVTQTITYQLVARNPSAATGCGSVVIRTYNVNVDPQPAFTVTRTVPSTNPYCVTSLSNDPNVTLSLNLTCPGNYLFEYQTSSDGITFGAWTAAGTGANLATNPKFFGAGVSTQTLNSANANIPAAACPYTFYRFRVSITGLACSSVQTTDSLHVFAFPVGGTTSITGATSMAVTTPPQSLPTSIVDLCGTTNSVTLNWVPGCTTFNGWDYSLNNGGTWYSTGVTTTPATFSNLPQTTWYRARVTNGAPCTTIAYSNVVQATVNQVNGGTADLNTYSICTGNTVTASVTGYLGGVRSWQMRTDNAFTASPADSLPGSNSSTITSPVLTASGVSTTYYFRAVIVSNNCIAYSNIISVVVYNTTLGGTLNISPTTYCSNSNTGTITLSGHRGSVVKWQSSTDAFATVTNDITNTTNTLTFNNLAAGTYTYRAVVQNGSCAAANSATVTITVNPAPVAGTVTALDSTICATQLYETLTLTGSSGSIQWQFSNNGGTSWSDISAATATTYNASATGWYRAKVSGIAPCTPVFSNVVTLYVTPASVGGSVASPATVCAGSNSGTLTLSGQTGSVIKWQSSPDNATWTDITNINTTYNYSNLTSNTYFRAVVQNGICAPDNSASVLITVTPAPTIGTISAPSTTLCNTSSMNISLTSATNGTISWEVSSNSGSSWSAAVGSSNSLTYTIPTGTAAGTYIYRAKVTGNSPCGVLISNTVTVAVSSASVGGSVSPSTTTVCSSGNSGTLSLSGQNGNVIKWQSSPDNATWTDITNINTTLNYLNLTATTYYRAVVQSGVCAPDNSASAVVTVVQAPVVGTISAPSTTLCNTQSMNVTLTSASNGTISWEVSNNNGSSWSAAVGSSNSLTYTIPAGSAAGTYQYRAKVTGTSPCGFVISNTVTVAISSATIGGIVTPATTTVCSSGNSGTLYLSGQNGNVIKWQSSPDNSTWTDITNVNTNIDYLNLTSTTYYRAVVRSGVCADSNSASAVVTVIPAPTVGTISAPSTTLCNTNSMIVTLTSSSNGVISWEVSNNSGSSYSAAVGSSNSLTYTIPAGTAAGTYIYRARVTGTSPCTSVISNTVTVTVSSASIGGNVSPLSTVVCSSGNSGVLTLSGQNGNVVKWQSSPDNFVTPGNITDITNINTTYTYNNLTTTTWFRAIVRSGVCADSASASALVTVIPAPTVGTISAPAALLCNSGSMNITLTSSANGVISWEVSSNNGSTFTAATGSSNSLTYTIPTGTAAGVYIYRARVTGTSPCGSVVSNTVTVTVYQQPTIGTLSGPSLAVCNNANSGTLTLSSGTGNLVWEYNETSATYTGVWNTISGQTALTYNFTNLTATTYYRVRNVATSPCVDAVSNVITVTVYPLPVANLSAALNNICFGSSTTLNGSNTGSVAGVTRYKITTNLGATIYPYASADTTVAPPFPITVSPAVTTTYTYTVTNPTSSNCSSSSSTTIVVTPQTIGGKLLSSNNLPFVIVCPGANSGVFNLSGQLGNVIKWQTSPDNATWSDVTNTSTTIAFSNVIATTYYRAVVQNAPCNIANSSVAVVWINTPPVANFTNTTQCFNVPPTVFTNTSTSGSSIPQSIVNALVSGAGLSGTYTITNSDSWSWNFGDPTSGANNTSLLQNPTHAYTAAGTYNATLITTTTTLVNGSAVAACSNNVTKQVTVNPVTTADYTTSPVCLGGASAVNISNYASGNTYVINWGDGTASQTANASTMTRTYGNAGRYSVRLRVTNTYGCSDSITKNVTAWALPVCTGVSISNPNPCANVTITFAPIGDNGGTTFVIDPVTGIATSTVANAASIVSYFWDFGDGNTATTRTAVNTYANAGVYTVKLTITNSNGCSQTFNFIANPITVQPLPTANFSNTTNCYGFATNFTDLSTIASGSVTGWSWNFGDPTSGGNNTSVSQNPTHMYTAAGTYNVSLTVTSNSGCTGTVTKQVTVNPLPLMNFTLSASSACAGTTITAISTATIASGTFNYGWRVSDNTGAFNFGTGLVYANANMVQTFNTPGTYNVRLIATSNNGCQDSITKSFTINANPTAAIVVTPGTNQICIYEAFTFNSTGSLAGSGTIAGYAWNFGDGSTSTAGGPITKSYANPGTYLVTLTITNSNGCVNTKTTTVTVNPKPVVNFTSSNVCFGYLMNFTDASTTSAGSSYLWNFGDPASGASNTATTQNASHNFTAAGTYSVKLVVTNNTGCKDSTTKLVTVWPKPVAAFKADTACEGTITTFTNQSTIASGSMSFMWYFGDAANSTSTSINPTFLYTPGVYTVRLIVTSGFGCIDSTTRQVLVKANPKPKFVVANACLRDAITLDTAGSNGTAAAQLVIDYGDGTPSTNVLTHTYAMSGTYTISLTMIDNGCSSTISDVVTIYDLPLPNFSVSRYSICMNELDTFSNTTTINSGSLVSHKWEVINSANVVVSSVVYNSAQEFIYAFNTPGVFRVRLTSTSDKGCIDTLSKSVTVNALPTVAINSVGYLSQAFHACLGTAHQFTSTGSTAGSGTITNYAWDFGDGGTSTVANPTYLYKAVGSYVVTLTIKNSNGCEFSKTQTVVVDPIPTADIQPAGFPAEVCFGKSMTLTGPAGTGYNYQWTNNGVTLSTTISVTVTPIKSSWYYLTVTSSYGCTKTDSIFITVNPLPVIVLSQKNVTISRGWKQQVTANVSGINGTFTYQWVPQSVTSEFPINKQVVDPSNRNFSGEFLANPILIPPYNWADTTYTFTVIVTDQKGCTDSAKVVFHLLKDYNIKPTNLMTPNNDGKNDFFSIENIETYPDAEVTIFNRWGDVVYQTKNYSANPWNGTYKNTGGDCPDGTYFYIIRTGATNGDIIYKGNITIIRGR